MRMIDADALAEAIGVKRLMIQSWTPDSAWGVPIVDAEPVVWCKDCQYDKTCVIQSIIIEASILPFDSNTWFCADGKRREDGADDEP